MRKFLKKFLLIVFLLSGVNLFAQDIDIYLDNQPFTILTDETEPVLGASVSTGVYPSGIGLNLDNNPGNDNSFTKPEFLILSEFKFKKDRNKSGMLSLYDEESKLMADSKTNIDQAADAYKNFKDFELISKNSVGDFIRIRYNLLRNDGGYSPWVAMIRKLNGRYYLTETVPLTSLFILTASCHPNNTSTAPYVPLEASKLNKLNFISEGFTESPGTSDVKEKNIEIFYKINTDNNSAMYSVLNDMKSALNSGDKEKYLSLWNSEERGKIAASDNFESNFTLHKDFYDKVKSIIPLGYIKSNNEGIVFFKAVLDEKTSVYQTIPVEILNGKAFLKSSLGNYYAWMLINHPLVKAGIFNSLEK